MVLLLETSNVTFLNELLILFDYPPSSGSALLEVTFGSTDSGSGVVAVGFRLSGPGFDKVRLRRKTTVPEVFR